MVAAFPASSGTLPVRLRIPRMGIAAGVVFLDLDANGIMQSPDGPDPVGWYTFSALPGLAGNAVFSGHVDWHTGVTGAFWGLRELRSGDVVYVDGQDGHEYVYSVATSKAYPENGAPLAEIVGFRPGQQITLLTCEGVFDRSTRDYDQRRVVVARRIR